MRLNRAMKGFLSMFCGILLLSSIFMQVNASVTIPDVETYQGQADSIQKEIDSVNAEINEYNINLENAHQLAQSARALEIDENDDIIVRAKTIWVENSKKIEDLQVKLTELNSQLESVSKYNNYTYVGDFKLTAYCPCQKCCDKAPSNPNYGKTAMGTRATEGRTVAMDSRFPFGTHVYIEGLGERIVEDRGGAIKGNRIDVYDDSHQDCFSAQYNGVAKVYIIE